MTGGEFLTWEIFDSQPSIVSDDAGDTGAAATTPVIRTAHRESPATGPEDPPSRVTTNYLPAL